MAKQKSYPAILYDQPNYPVAQVAQHLCCTVRTLERYDEQKLLPITRLTRRHRVVLVEHLLRFEMTRDGADLGVLLSRIRPAAGGAALNVLRILAAEVNAHLAPPDPIGFPLPGTSKAGAEQGT